MSGRDNAPRPALILWLLVMILPSLLVWGWLIARLLP